MSKGELDPDVIIVCAEYEVRIIPANVVPAIGETRAPATLSMIKRKHGLDHMRLVVGILAETENNRNALIADIIWATSDILLAFRKNYPLIFEREISKLYEFFDALPLAALYFKYCLPLEGITSKRRALVGQIFERAEIKFGADAGQGDMFDDRRRAA